MPTTTDYLPTREADLVQWSSTFGAYITANAAAVGLSAAQATAYNGLQVAFSDAWALANANATRTPSSIETKDGAKDALISGPDGIRALVPIVQAFPGTTNAMRRDMGLTVRDSEPTPVPAPTLPPDLAVQSVLDRTVTFRLRDIQDTTRRGRPAGVDGATILMFVGDSPPGDPLGWTLLMNTSKTTLSIDFPPSIQPGAKVWLTAFWFNQRKESGPIASPVSVRLSDGLAAAA